MDKLAKLIILQHLIICLSTYSNAQNVKLNLENYPILMSFRLSTANKTSQELKLMQNYDIYQVYYDTKADSYNPNSIKILRNVYSAIEKESPLFKDTYNGHWLYFNGTKLTKDLGIEDYFIFVENSNLFLFDQNNVSRQDDLIIYSLDKNNQPIWENAEHLSIKSIDYENNKIEVGRGLYSNPKIFNNGAIVAPHTMGLLELPNSKKRWGINLSPLGPKDANGMSGELALASKFTNYIKSDGSYSGIQFDTGGYIGEHAPSTEFRKSDINNDLKPDNKYEKINGDTYPSYGLGSIIFTNKLREGLGNDFIILGDFNSVSNGWRGYTNSNGIEIENSLEDEVNLDAYSFNRDGSWKFAYYGFIRKRTQSPHLSYILCKGPTELYSKDNNLAKGSNNYFRLLFAVNMLGDGVISYTSAHHNNALGFDYFTWWDEYLGGKLNKKGYLGKPIDSPKRLFSYKKDNLLGSYFDLSTRVIDGYKISKRIRIKQNQVDFKIKKIANYPNKVSNNGIIVRWPLQETLKNIPYTLRFTIKCDIKTPKEYPEFSITPMTVKFSLGQRPNFSNRKFFLCDAEEQKLEFTIWPDSLKYLSETSKLFLYFGTELGNVYIKNAELIEGDSFTMYRKFENGIILMNGTEKEKTFKINEIDPNSQYYYIDGNYTPKVNNGQKCKDHIIVPPYDGRVLIKGN